MGVEHVRNSTSDHFSVLLKMPPKVPHSNHHSPRVGHGAASKGAGQEPHDEQSFDRLATRGRSVEEGEWDVGEDEHRPTSKDLGAWRPKQRTNDETDDISTRNLACQR